MEPAAHQGTDRIVSVTGLVTARKSGGGGEVDQRDQPGHDQRGGDADPHARSREAREPALDGGPAQDHHGKAEQREQQEGIGHDTRSLDAGDVVRTETPGGGGWGR